MYWHIVWQFGTKEYFICRMRHKVEIFKDFIDREELEEIYLQHPELCRDNKDNRKERRLTLGDIVSKILLRFSLWL